MRIVVTGTAGFVGQALVSALRGRGDTVIAIDRALGGMTGIEGDLTDPATLELAFADGCDAVVHLATIPGGAAEGDPNGAWRVNVDGSRALAQAAAKASARPRFIFASSIAVLGGALPATGVDDATPPRPELLYGGHKLIVEAWLAMLSERGAIDALSVRLPGIVARPAGSVALRSAFMSDAFHALAAGRPFTAPVSPRASFWIQSRQRIVANLLHALDMPMEALPPQRTVNLPALHVTMETLASAIAPGAAITYAPDATLEAQFGSYPPLATPRADALGFAHDGSIEALAATVVDGLREEAR